MEDLFSDIPDKRKKPPVDLFADIPAKRIAVDLFGDIPDLETPPEKPSRTIQIIKKGLINNS